MDDTDRFSLSSARALLDGRRLAEDFGVLSADIQRALLGLQLESVPGLDIGLKSAPSRVAGGDYFDVIVRPGAGPIFGIGDVAGQSFPAATKALTLKFVIRALVEVLGDDLAAMLGITNRTLSGLLHYEQYASALLCLFSAGNRSLVVANAGHDPPLLLRAGESQPQALEPSGLVLACEPGSQYVHQAAPVGRGDIIILYTDGFTEARSATGEQFTLAHLKRGLAGHRDLPAQELADVLFAAVETFTAGTFRDDATVMVIRVVGQEAHG